MPALLNRSPSQCFRPLWCFHLPLPVTPNQLLHSSSLSFLFSSFADLNRSSSPSCSMCDHIVCMCVCFRPLRSVNSQHSCSAAHFPPSFPFLSSSIFFCRQTCPLQHFLPSLTVQHLVPYSCSCCLRYHYSRTVHHLFRSYSIACCLTRARGEMEVCIWMLMQMQSECKEI